MDQEERIYLKQMEKSLGIAKTTLGVMKNAKKYGSRKAISKAYDDYHEGVCSKWWE